VPPLKFGAAKPANVVTQGRQAWFFLAIAPEKEYPKLFKILGAPQKIVGGQS